MLKYLTLTNIKLGISYLKRNGIKSFFNQFLIYTSSDYSNYNYYIRKTSLSKKERLEEANYCFQYNPLYGLIYNSNKALSAPFVKAITTQTYTNMVLFIPENQKNNINISNIKIFFYTSVEDILHIECSHYIFIDENNVPAPNLLFEITYALNEQSFDIIYYDEDILQNGKRSNPKFKPDFNYHLLLQYNYIGNCFCVSKTAVQKIFLICNSNMSSLKFDILIFAKRNLFSVKHICKILNHNLNEPITNYALYSKSLLFYFNYYNIHATITNKDNKSLRISYALENEPLVSIIIPNKDHVEDLSKCICSIKKSTYTNYEILIVENNSENANTFAYYDTIKSSQIQILHWNNEFNYASINNFAVQKSKGQYIVFLNNDTEIISSNWLQEMLMYCQQDDIGIVGALLYYPDYTVQHSGVILGIGGVAGHAHKNVQSNETGYDNRLHVAQEYSCVTAACMMVKKELFIEVDQFDENFKVAFNDIDLCLKIRKQNYYIIYTPYAQLLHYESKSRGAEDTSEKKQRFNSEVNLFRKKWHTILDAGDPYYNPNLTLLYEDFSLKRKVEYRSDFSFYKK